MRQIANRTLFLAGVTALSVYAGALVLEIGNPETNAEARSMNAVLVARATACHEPAKSTVTAALVELDSGQLHRSVLQVVPLKTAGSFAVMGTVPPGSVVDLAVTNPEYSNYQPHVLVRSNAQGLQFATAQRFFGKPPTDANFRDMLPQGS